ncbi:alpha/beta hydrolase [Mycolicibacterium neoaurum]|uniref:alpha/beta fold hydrolase n=1 Tax=Mycolicibacterium neoaurum TaxID=1795 RepID=UPI00248A92C8|nr:alpha/beta hydrolase [Mycolicibacterium neoaurum]WBP94420.1 alpha/beta hydrolase [Mycolicibacterium neoaurum]WBS06389.1 alpha/beta hydrolase [Mycolicibacterium neoaurum]
MRHVDITVGGGPVRVYLAGEAGPALVLLHGAMLDTGLGVWHDVIADLARDHRVYVVDLPRHGGSRPWRGTLDDRFYRRFMGALLDELGLDRVGLIGLSLGGGVATGFALEHPDRVDALVAIGPGGLDAVRPYQFLTWVVTRTPGLLRATSWLLARFPGLVRSSLAATLTAGVDTPGFDRIVGSAVEEALAKNRHGERALDDWQVQAYGPRTMRVYLTPELHRLAVPTLWIRGSDDPLVGADVLDEAHARTPDSQLVAIAGAGHIVTYDQPAEVLRVLREFLRSRRE